MDRRLHGAWNEAKGLLEQAVAEKRAFTRAEQDRWNAVMAELTALTLAAAEPEPMAAFERGGTRFTVVPDPALGGRG
jgi:hypothetical protein